MAKDRSESPRIHYDWLIQADLQRFYPDFAAWVLGDRPLEVVAIHAALPATAIRYPDQILDIRTRDGRRILLHVEFQIEDRPEVRRRMVQSAALVLNLLSIEEHRGKTYASVVIYLDEEEYRGDDGRFACSGDLGFALSLRYRVIRLWELDPEPILHMDAPGLWPFVPLMRGKPEELVVKSKERILAAHEGLVPSDAKKVLFAILAAFAQRRLPDRRTFQGLVLEIRRMGNKNVFFDILIEEGIEKGLLIGREEGRREAAREALLKVVSRKYGAPDQDLCRRLEAVADPVELERLIEEAAVAPNLDAFLAALDPPLPR